MVVLGGSGFLGGRVVAALKAAGADVQVASRRSAVAVDVTQPATWEALAPFELVIDLSDTVSHAPDELIAWCLARGKTVIEATSDAPCVERLQARFGTETRGRLVLGGGIFTGVSNLLAQDVARAVGTVEAVTLGVSSSPFSGSGKGTIELMLRAMEVPAVRYERGQRVEEPKIRKGPVLDFGNARRPTGFMSLAEPSMVRASTKAADVEVLFAPKPSLLVTAFVLLPAWLVRQKWFHAFMRAYFTVLRRVLLRSVPSSVQLVASARGGGQTVTRHVHSPDGMEGAGYALAAMAEGVASAAPWQGVRCIDELVDLGPIVARANALAGKTVLAVS